MTKKRDIYFALLGFLQSIPEGSCVLLNEIKEEFQISIRKVKSTLKLILVEHPSLINRVAGYYPDVDTVISLAEGQGGIKLTKSNLWEMNVACKKIIDSITKPFHEQYIHNLFKDHIANEEVKISYSKLIDLIYEDYNSFVDESGNSISSIAGRLNEELLFKGLEAAGLVKGNNFIKTGRDSKSDLKVMHHETGGDVKSLYIEIKSYHARERFLRGLRDIPHPEKIGAGFFVNAKEFNPRRTQLYISVGTYAIYMPDRTYEQLDPKSLEFVSCIQSRLYRKLSQFSDDMVCFSKTGNLPKH